MDFEADAVSTELIAMNITIAALEGWLKNVPADRGGEDLGREIGALYREIFSAVDEMSPRAGDHEDEEEDEDEEDEYEDERD